MSDPFEFLAGGKGTPTPALMPNQIDRMLKAILDELKANFDFDNLIVDFYSGKYAFFDLEGYEAAILVAYSGSTFELPNNSSMTANKRNINFEVIILARQYAGQASEANNDIGLQPLAMNGLIEATRLSLVGNSFLGSTPFNLKSDSPLGGNKERSVFAWQLEFTTSIPVMAAQQLRKGDI